MVGEYVGFRGLVAKDARLVRRIEHLREKAQNCVMGHLEMYEMCRLRMALTPQLMNLKGLEFRV